MSVDVILVNHGKARFVGSASFRGICGTSYDKFLPDASLPEPGMSTHSHSEGAFGDWLYR